MPGVSITTADFGTVRRWLRGLPHAGTGAFRPVSGALSTSIEPSEIFLGKLSCCGVDDRLL